MLVKSNQPIARAPGVSPGVGFYWHARRLPVLLSSFVRINVVVACFFHGACCFVSSVRFVVRAIYNNAGGFIRHLPLNVLDKVRIEGNMIAPGKWKLFYTSRTVFAIGPDFTVLVVPGEREVNDAGQDIMALQYSDLDDNVRRHMRHELEQDCGNNRLYISLRLTSACAQAWLAMMREAIDRYDDAWLAAELRDGDCMRRYERRRGANYATARVPVTGPEQLAEGEFNRYYMRGLCAEVLAAGGNLVEVYRGKRVAKPRPDSETLVGQRLPAQQLLEDLRNAPGSTPALGLPPGPNSGLTVKRV